MRPGFVLCAAVALSTIACGSGDATGPGIDSPGFTFSYVDTTGRHLTFSADSGTWSQDANPGYVFTNLYASAPADFQGKVHFQFFNGIAVPDPPDLLPVGTHRINDTQGLNLAFSAYLPLGFLGQADSGTVTITKRDAQHLDGHLEVYLSNPTPQSLVAPFRLKGSFALTYRAAGT